MTPEMQGGSSILLVDFDPVVDLIPLTYVVNRKGSGTLLNPYMQALPIVPFVHTLIRLKEE